MDARSQADRPKTFGPRAAWAALLAMGLALAATSCNRIPALEEKKTDRADADGAAGDDKPQPSPEDYKEVSRLFGEALVEGEYGAAYQFTSSRLQKRMSREEFAQACTDAVLKFGQAERLGPVVVELTDGLEGADASQQYGFPAEIPNDDRLAWVHAALALELDGDEILRYYDCWMLMENDGGKARVGHFSFTLGD